jgi:hypothetical protein
MDPVWQSAPVPALHVRRAAGSPPALEVRANGAAARWSGARGLGADAWQELATRCWPSDTPGSGLQPVGAHTLLVHRVPLDDGALLLWLQPVQDAGDAAQAPQQRAGMLFEHTRLAAESIGVGFWSRNLDDGTAFWDAQMYRIHRRDPQRGPPGFDTWIDEHVHVNDRTWVMALHLRASHEWQAVVDAVFRANAGCRAGRAGSCAMASAWPSACTST